MNPLALSARSFARLTALFEQETGIRLGAQKQNLVVTRLVSRLKELKLTTLEEYCTLLFDEASVEERQILVDRLTTHETYFFREPEHFSFLARWLAQHGTSSPLRVWSAACSSGEEVYSIAMLLADLRASLQDQVFGSDISQREVVRAARAIYPRARLEQLPPNYLQRFFLRGSGAYEGMIRVAPAVRSRASFFQHNLLAPSSGLGTFDIVFLRNVLIYFGAEKKREIVGLVRERLVRGGLLIVGLSESLHGHEHELRSIGRSIYQVL